MDKLPVVGSKDHESTFEMWMVFAGLLKDYPIDTEPESRYPNISAFVNPQPCSTSDESLSKNALCSCYDQCLNLAVEKKWPQFTCIDCGLKDVQVRTNHNARDILGCCRLLSKIFMQEKKGSAVF